MGDVESGFLLSRELSFREVCNTVDRFRGALHSVEDEFSLSRELGDHEVESRMSLFVERWIMPLRKRVVEAWCASLNELKEGGETAGRAYSVIVDGMLAVQLEPKLSQLKTSRSKALSFLG